MPQAFARAIARSCADVSPLLLKLLHTLFHLRFANVSKTLMFRFRFWEPQEVPSFCNAHASTSCARGCAQLCGCTADGNPKLLHALLSLLILRMLEKLRFSSSNFGNPKQFQILATRMPQASARGCAQLCGYIAVAAQVAAPIAFICVCIYRYMN